MHGRACEKHSGHTIEPTMSLVIGIVVFNSKILLVEVGEGAYGEGNKNSLSVLSYTNQGQISVIWPWWVQIYPVSGWRLNTYERVSPK